MSHRDDCLITTVEDVTDWLAQYRHTIGTFDPQVLRVIEVLEQVAFDNDCDRQTELDRVTEDRNQINDSLEQVLQICRDYLDDCDAENGGEVIEQIKNLASAAV